MKVTVLLKMILKEFRLDIFISILLFALVDFTYTKFTGVTLNRESGTILWQGGNDIYTPGLSTVLLKLLNVSIVFITVGKIADKLSGDITIYILARITNYRYFIFAYTIIVILSGELLLAVSHMIYYCFAGFYPEQALSGFIYLLMDELGFLSILTLYLILNNCCLLENSFIYIICLYLLNTVLPVPVLPAMSTVKFFILRSQVAMAPLFLSLAGIDLTVAFFYYELIKRRRINVC